MSFSSEDLGRFIYLSESSQHSSSFEEKEQSPQLQSLGKSCHISFVGQGEYPAYNRSKSGQQRKHKVGGNNLDSQSCWLLSIGLRNLQMAPVVLLVGQMGGRVEEEVL
jgi:hypothetical protein